MTKKRPSVSPLVLMKSLMKYFEGCNGMSFDGFFVPLSPDFAITSNNKKYYD